MHRLGGHGVHAQRARALPSSDSESPCFKCFVTFVCHWQCTRSNVPSQNASGHHAEQTRSSPAPAPPAGASSDSDAASAEAAELEDHDSDGDDAHGHSTAHQLAAVHMASTQSTPPVHPDRTTRPGWEGGRECRPRALTKLLQYSRLARATTRRPPVGGWSVVVGKFSPTIPADATLVHLSRFPRTIISRRFRRLSFVAFERKRSFVSRDLGGVCRARQGE